MLLCYLSMKNTPCNFGLHFALILVNAEEDSANGKKKKGQPGRNTKKLNQRLHAKCEFYEN